ncbi:hypothetical protein NVP2275O_477 [Vibrio phage 2.275.O._10N.286.54.E11]|nr:hypothetical protein NVP2275O_477 [Vibrio phage 2.275.O._10N.286.54.E11]
MGVSFYSCSACNEAVYEEYIRSCECCQEEICSDCAGSSSQYGDDDLMNDDYEWLEHNCPYCNGTVITDAEIINYLFNHQIDRDREEVMEEFHIHRTLEKGK